MIHFGVALILAVFQGLTAQARPMPELVPPAFHDLKCDLVKCSRSLELAKGPECRAGKTPIDLMVAEVKKAGIRDKVLTRLTERASEVRVPDGPHMKIERCMCVIQDAVITQRYRSIRDRCARLERDLQGMDYEHHRLKGAQPLDSLSTLGTGRTRTLIELDQCQKELSTEDEELLWVERKPSLYFLTTPSGKPIISCAPPPEAVSNRMHRKMCGLSDTLCEVMSFVRGEAGPTPPNAAAAATDEPYSEPPTRASGSAR